MTNLIPAMTLCSDGNPDLLIQAARKARDDLQAIEVAAHIKCILQRIKHSGIKDLKHVLANP